MLSRAVRTVASLACIALGVVAAELVTRAATHSSIDYTSIFSPGPYCDRGRVGAFGACPGRWGVQRIPNAPIYAAYSIGPHGFRGPFRNVPPGQPAKKVLLIGGQSQGWGFGLNDDETFAAVMARSITCAPVEVQSAALLGGEDPISWEVYRTVVGDADPPVHVLHTVYWKISPRWRALIDDLKEQYTASPVAYRGGWYFIVPWETPQWLRESDLFVRGFKHFTEAKSYLTKIAAAIAAFAEPLSQPNGEQAGPAAEFLREVQAWAERAGGRFTLVVMPAGPAREHLTEPQFPPVQVVDLHEEALEAGLLDRTSPERNQLFSDGHYNPTMAEFIGRRLATEFCRTYAGR